MELLRIGFIKIGLIDIIDIGIVAFLFYKFLGLMKGTRAVQIITGVFLLFFIAFGAFWFELEGLKWLITNIATVGIIVFAIIFQPEIRGALAQIGHAKMFRRFYRYQEQKALDEIIDGVKNLSQRGYGGLVVLEKNIGLKNFEQTGRQLNAQLSSDFLITLFTPYAPLHDGAAIIRGDMVVSAGCTLPLSTNPRYEKLYGMRHRAAIGVTEVSDSIALVVSEETGTISLAYNGELQSKVEPNSLKDSLLELLKL
ncbi:MAG: diadenylate cyclase CdaA [Candidatus Zixiibacteriota bacterium]